jgi:outer membrane lipoprotein-sorting protein
MLKPVLATLAFAVALSGCAGRAPAPIAVVQMQDRYANCTAIMAEVNATTSGSANSAPSRAPRSRRT